LDTPFDIVSKKFPEYDDPTIRKFLAMVSLRGKVAMQPISTLSGGEQSKVKLCILMLTKHNVLILDEPTNHLDADCKNVLRQQLIDYEGTVILISHELEFYSD
jgi:ATPase subunit of ABC transporter with duplicated ATPase domains